MKLIKCPHPDRKKNGDEMYVSYCRDKCPHRKECKKWKKK
jgi:hypothetical protein